MLQLLPLVITVLVKLSGFTTDPFLRAPIPAELARPARGPDLVGVASRYGGPRDSRWGGAALACAPATHTDLQMHVCAHRRLPCGTMLQLENPRNGKRSFCRVMDRGPFGALDENGTWHVEVKLVPGHRRRGDFDLTPAVFAELGAKGLSTVRAWIRYRPARPLRFRGLPRHPKGEV